MFEVGKKVVCVDDAPAEEGEVLFGIKKDEIYPLLWISHNKCCGTMMLDIGIKSSEIFVECCPSCLKPIGILKPGGSVLFVSTRFRPVDYNFAEQVLEEIFNKELEINI